MWTVIINNIENSIANVSALFDDGTLKFTWNSIIKIGDEDNFSQTAKNQLQKYQEIHKDDIALKSQIETILNK